MPKSAFLTLLAQWTDTYAPFKSLCSLERWACLVIMWIQWVTRLRTNTAKTDTKKTLELFKASVLLQASPTSTSNRILHFTTKCIYVLCMIFRKNSECFSQGQSSISSSLPLSFSSYSMMLGPNCGSWLSCCRGFETFEFIRGEDVSPKPPKNINWLIFVSYIGNV